MANEICKQMMNTLLKAKGLKQKDIAVTKCIGDYVFEKPFGYKEIHAHCKYCAVFEYVAGELND